MVSNYYYLLMLLIPDYIPLVFTKDSLNIFKPNQREMLAMYMEQYIPILQWFKQTLSELKIKREP